MGGGESREEKKLEGLPLVKNRYRMVSILGQGNFGGVYKVQHKKNKRFYALKCVPVDALPGTNENQQKVVYQTALTEKKILKSLKHANVVRLIDSFVVPHNPAEKKPKKKKGKKKTRFFCLLLEYCHGNTLEAVLQKVEKKEEMKTSGKTRTQTRGRQVGQKKDKKKEKKEVEESELFIPKDLCLIWFIKLLETVAYVHGKKIIHCDLHPENILLTYRSINDYKNIDLKLSDFGAAKDISKNLARDLSGQIFYASPESVNQKLYDTRTDMWSLGIIFLNCYSQLSMDKYIKFIQKIFLKIKTVPELRKKFCARYKIKNEMAIHQVPWITLINFMHERQLFEGVIDEFIDDAGVRGVLSKMMCPYDERLYAADLIKDRTIQTWKYLLDREAKFNVKSFDLAGVITIMKLPDPFLFTRCLQILKNSVLDDPIVFVKNKGLSVMLKRVNNLREMYKRRYLKDIISISMKVLIYLQIHDRTLFDSSLREISVSFRANNCAPTLEKLLMFQNNDSLYYFTYLICWKSVSIRNKLCTVDNIRNLLMKLKRRNENYILAIVSILMSEMKEEQLETVTTHYKKKNMTIFKKCKLRHRVFNTVLKSIYQEILTVTDKVSENDSDSDEDEEKEETEEEKYMIELLSTTIFMVQNYNNTSKKHEDYKLVFNRVLSDRIKLGLGKGCKTFGKKVELDTNNHVIGLKVIEEKKLIEMITNQPLCMVKELVKDDEKEECISYYEIHILNGGRSDNVILGFSATTVKPCQVLLQCSTGRVAIVDVNKQVKQETIPEIYCETGSTVGCGVTNKGRVFWTRNNKMYQMVQFFPPSVKKYTYAVPLKASIRMKRNIGFRGRVNFGTATDNGKVNLPFCFKFSEVVPKKEVKYPRGFRVPEKLFEINKHGLNCIKHETDPGGLILQKVKANFEKNEFICALVNKIQNFEKENTRREKKSDDDDEEEEDDDDDEESVDDELLEIYTEPCYSEKKVAKAFAESEEFRKDFIRRKKGVKGSKSMISLMYKELQQGISERANKDDDDDDDGKDDGKNKKKKESPNVERIKVENRRGNRNSVADFFASNFFGNKDGSLMDLLDSDMFDENGILIDEGEEEWEKKEKDVKVKEEGGGLGGVGDKLKIKEEEEVEGEEVEEEKEEKKKEEKEEEGRIKKKEKKEEEKEVKEEVKEERRIKKKEKKAEVKEERISKKKEKEERSKMEKAEEKEVNEERSEKKEKKEEEKKVKEERSGKKERKEEEEEGIEKKKAEEKKEVKEERRSKKKEKEEEGDSGDKELKDVKKVEKEEVSESLSTVLENEKNSISSSESSSSEED